MWHVKMAGGPKGARLLTGDIADESRVREAWEEYGDPAGCGGAGPIA